MPRKDKKEWTTIELNKKVIKRLDKLKVHPNQSYSEVIENLLNKGKVTGEVKKQ